MEKEFAKLTRYLEERFEKIDNSFDSVFENFITKEEFKPLSKDVSGLREQVQSLTNSIDKLVGGIDDLRTEYASITHKIDRHEKWIEQIAEKVGLRLES